MKCRLESADGTLTIHCAGKFRFDDHVTMKMITRSVVLNNIRSVTVNVLDLEYIDSAGIGMLLVLAEEVKNLSGMMTVMNPIGAVERVFRLARVDTLIRIVST